MTIEDELRELMIKKSGSVNKFSQECGLSQSTIFTYGHILDGEDRETAQVIDLTFGAVLVPFATKRKSPQHIAEGIFL